MKNCTVKIYDAMDVLESGQRVADKTQTNAVYEGPATISTPTRAWQQAAAIEGIFSAVLSVHTRDNLLKAKLVLVDNNSMSGLYTVAQDGVNGEGTNWTLFLSRRP